MPRKRQVRVFVSHARANRNLAKQFMDKFGQQVSASKYYNYFFWQDWNIIVGEEWSEQIEQVLVESNLGLLLISPAFLASQFITEIELPALVGSKKKAVIPVMLWPVDFERHDLRGLEKHQIFRLGSPGFKSPKSYGECSGNQRERFAYKLFQEVEQSLDRLFRRGRRQEGGQRNPDEQGFRHKPE